MSQRLPQLDVLRAVAILLVCGGHMRPATKSDAGPIVATITEAWARGGWVGVDLFFVLSGFLVSGLLFQEYQRTGTVTISRFLIRRGFKIYPAFWLVLVVSVAVGWKAIGWQRIVSDVFFMQNYVPAVTFVTWSLAVEEHFYLLLAGMFWALARYSDQPFRWIPHIWLAVAVACLAGRLALIDQPYTHMTHLFPTHLRVDGLMFGVMLSYGWHCGWLQERARPWSRWLCVSGCACLSPAFLFTLERTPWIASVGLTLFYVGAGALLIGALGLRCEKRGFIGSLATIGAYSYSIYLWHFWVAILATVMLWPVNWFLYSAGFFAGALGVGIITAKAVEYPALAVRDRYFTSRVPTSVPSVAMSA